MCDYNSFHLFLCHRGPSTLPLCYSAFFLFFFFWYFNATIRKFKIGHVALLTSAGPIVCWSMVRNEAHTLAAVTSGISQTILQTMPSTTQEGLSVLLYIEGLNHRRGFTQQVAL